MPGSASDKPLSRSSRSSRLGPCSSSHFQYCAPRIQLPRQLGHLNDVRFDSKSVEPNSNDLHTGQFRATSRQDFNEVAATIFYPIAIGLVRRSTRSSRAEGGDMIIA